jgi:hypothetical protein
MGAPDQANATIYTFRAYKFRTNVEHVSIGVRRRDGCRGGCWSRSLVEQFGAALVLFQLAIVHQPNCHCRTLSKTPPV